MRSASRSGEFAPELNASTGATLPQDLHPVRRVASDRASEQRSDGGDDEATVDSRLQRAYWHMPPTLVRSSIAPMSEPTERPAQGRARVLIPLTTASGTSPLPRACHAIPYRARDVLAGWTGGSSERERAVQ